MITGFPSPAQGYEDKIFDLNTFCVRHPAATVFMTIDTDRYNAMSIYRGDLVIVDRAKKLTVNSLEVYENEGEFVIGYLRNIKNEVQVTGAVIKVIHTVRDL